MFDNISKKIKTIAKAVAFLGTVLSIVYGVITIINSGSGDGEIVIAIVTIISGIVISIVSAILIYGFGHLIENSDIIAGRSTQVSESKQSSQSQDKNLRNWESSISKLSDEEINERINSDDWCFEYKELCKKELKKRTNI